MLAYILAASWQPPREEKEGPITMRDTVYIALFAALTAALGLFPPLNLLPTGVPITAQSMGPMLAGALLGARRGAFAMVLFLSLVALGLPLLAGGNGGFSVFVGLTGGFLVGWVLAAYTIGWLIEKVWDRLRWLTAALIITFGGIVVPYLVGNLWVSVVLHISYVRATFASLPFLVGDAFKVVIATGVAMTVRRTYPLISS